MADTNKPYRRTGANSWEELLDKVNDVLENPDDGCDPLDPIETPESPHRWAKSDVREVHDRLNEMPGDCFEFDEIPDLWKKSIIDEIEEQLENAWCECEGCKPCDTESREWENIHLHAWAWEICGYNPSGPSCGETLADWAGIQYYWELTRDEIDYYEAGAVDMCFFNMDLHELEADLAEAESELAAAEAYRDSVCAAGTSPQCTAAQADVDAKQQVVDDLEDEIEEVEEYIEEARTMRDDGSAAADAAALAGWSLLAAMSYTRSGTSTVTGPDYENITEKLLAAIGTMPWHKDDTCTNIFLFPWRCRGGWQVRKENKCFGGCTCNLLYPDHFIFTSSYTPSGIPVPTNITSYIFASAFYGRCSYYLDPALSGCDVILPPPAGCNGVEWDARVRYPDCPPGTPPNEEPPPPGDPIELP